MERARRHRPCRVLAEHVDELHTNRIAEGLRDLRHPLGLVTFDVRVDHRLAARFSDGRFCFGASARSTTIYTRISIEVMFVNG